MGNTEQASNQLLEWMIENQLECRVIFVVRYYSGKKIGPTRFRRILEAAEECMETYPINRILDIQQKIVKKPGDYKQEDNLEHRGHQQLKTKQTKITNYRHNNTRGKGGGRGRTNQSNQDNKRKGSPLHNPDDTYIKRKNQQKQDDKESVE